MLVIDESSWVLLSINSPERPSKKKKLRMRKKEREEVSVPADKGTKGRQDGAELLNEAETFAEIPIAITRAFACPPPIHTCADFCCHGRWYGVVEK